MSKSNSDISLKSSQVANFSTGHPIRDTIRFGICTDSHYAEKEVVDYKYYSHSLLKMKEFVQRMNEEGVDFIIHLGDFKDEDPDPEPLRTLEYLGRVEDIFHEFYGPTYHCLGNHDVDSIRKDQFLNRVSNSGIAGDLTYYSFVRGTVRFIVLDSNFDSEGKDHFFALGGDWQAPYIPEPQLNWLKRELSGSTQPCLIFCHHPAYAYVKNGYRYHLTNYLEVREVLENSNKVIAYIHGHLHEEMFHEINNIRYLAMNSMLEGSFDQRNCFYRADIGSNRLKIDRYDRDSNNLTP